MKSKQMLPKGCIYDTKHNQVICKSTCNEVEDEHITEQVAQWAEHHGKNLVRTRHIRNVKEGVIDDVVRDYPEYKEYRCKGERK